MANFVNGFVFIFSLIISFIVLLCDGHIHKHYPNHNYDNMGDGSNEDVDSFEDASITGNHDLTDDMPMHDGTQENSYYFLGHPTGVSKHPMSLTNKIQNISDQKNDDKVTDILHGLLAKYDNRIRPNPSDKPTLIEVSTLTLQVVTVDESKSEFSSIVLLQQLWLDPRLVYETLDESMEVPYITISHEHARDLWLPDTIFMNEKKAEVHEVTMTNDAVVLFRNGTVIRSTRIAVSTHCPFQYDAFPFDSQQCELLIGSHGYGESNIQFFWKEDLVFLASMKSNGTSWTSLVSDVHTGRFLVTALKFNETKQKFSLGVKSQLSLQVTLQRAWRPFITRFYLPMILFVFVSLGTLFIRDMKAALIINLFNLAFINIFIALRSANDDTPTTSTKTALDEYFIICLFYILFIVAVTIFKLVRETQKTYQITGSPSRTHSRLSVLPASQSTFIPEFRMQQNHRRRHNADQMDIFNPMSNRQEGQGSSQNNSQYANGHGIESETNCDEIDNDLRRIYRSPSYPLQMSSRTRIVLRKGKKFGHWLGKYLKWIVVATFLITDFIYFKSHT